MTTSEIAKKLGRLGGLKRAQRLSNQRLTEIARKGSQARKESFLLARRIEVNFNYVASIRELQPPKPVISNPTSPGPLPKIHG